MRTLVKRKLVGVVPKCDSEDVRDPTHHRLGGPLEGDDQPPSQQEDHTSPIREQGGLHENVEGGPE